MAAHVCVTALGVHKGKLGAVQGEGPATSALTLVKLFISINYMCFIVRDHWLWLQVRAMPLKVGKHRHPPAARWLAVLLGGLVSPNCYSNADAAADFRRIYNSQAEALLHDAPVSDVAAFLKHWREQFAKNGSVKDAARRGRHPKVAAADAKRYGDLLMVGTTEVVLGPDGEVMWQGHRPFTSMRDACQHCEELALACMYHSLTPRSLLKHIRPHCPDLARRSTASKVLLSEDVRQQRQSVCQQLLDSFRWQVPKTTFIDCATYTVKFKPKKLMVWVHRGDKTFKLPWSPPPGGAPKEAITLHWVVAVHAARGLVYFEFTSGTTDIRRARTFEPADMRKEHYMVSRPTPSGRPLGWPSVQQVATPSPNAAASAVG